MLDARGDGIVGIIRNPDHASDVRQAGASAVVCDLEQANVEEVAVAIEGADAVVFAAGAGPGSGAERKVAMDRDGAIKLLRAAASSSVGRYAMVSSAGVEDPPRGEGALRSTCGPRQLPMWQSKRVIWTGRSCDQVV
jgi:nucleoside-diphosphate-sugar epimerase